MSILDIERYYYFKLRNGNPYTIKVSLVPINTIINRSYVEMTEEQKAFYLEHPTATVMEVWNCEITPPYVPPTPDVQEYAQEKLKEMKDACYSSISVSTLEFAMAIDKVENITADSYYSLTEARHVVSDFRSQSKHAMQVYDTYKPQIESAQTIDAVDEIYQQAMEEL
ncbi:MAG: hypothetical protein IIV14_10440 [Bacteroidaceae bacterium]|nr:hypothetical protein [Bacteroidaceae bacterium]